MSNNRVSPNTQLLSANRKEPIQHLPFFSSTELQIDQANDEKTSQSSSRMSKLEAARHSRMAKKLQQTTTGGLQVSNFSSSFKDAAALQQQQLSGRDSNHQSQQNFQTIASTTSREDQKLGDLALLQDRYNYQDDYEDEESSQAERQVFKRQSHNEGSYNDTAGMNNKNMGGRASAQSQGLNRRQSPEGFVMQASANDEYVQKGRMSYKVQTRSNRGTDALDTMSQTNSNKTIPDKLNDAGSHNSKSVGDNKPRRRRGDRSKGETASGAVKRLPKVLSKQKYLTKVQETKSVNSVKIQPVCVAPVVNYELKNQNAVEKESCKAVDFANMLLAKHEANMRQREMQGYYGQPKSPAKTDNQDMTDAREVGEHQQVVIFPSEIHKADAYQDEVNNEQVSHFRSLQQVQESEEADDTNMMNSASRPQNKDQKTGETRMENENFNQNDDLTLNSQEVSPQENKEYESSQERAVNRRGSNFQSNNAFDESIQESPIKRRDDADKTMMDENRRLFGGETPSGLKRDQINVQHNNYVQDEDDLLNQQESHQISPVDDYQDQEVDQSVNESSSQFVDKSASQERRARKQYSSSQLFSKKQNQPNSQASNVSSQQQDQSASPQSEDMSAQVNIQVTRNVRDQAYVYSEQMDQSQPDQSQTEHSNVQNSQSEQSQKNQESQEHRQSLVADIQQVLEPTSNHQVQQSDTLRSECGEPAAGNATEFMANKPSEYNTNQTMQINHTSEFSNANDQVSTINQQTAPMTTGAELMQPQQPLANVQQLDNSNSQMLQSSFSTQQFNTAMVEQHQQVLQQLQQQQDSQQNLQVMVQQYELVFQQLNGQIQTLLLKNQQMENNQLQQEIALYQTQQREHQLQNQLQQEKVNSEVKLTQMCENHSQVQIQITQELDNTKQTLIDLETQAKQMSLVIQQQNEKIASLDHNCAIKEQQVQKLRQDNQSMFIDLKALAQNEERAQREMIELRKQRNELEDRNEQLVEQCQRQQAQIRSCYGENEQIKKEINSRSEQLPLMMQDMEQLQEENRILISKSQQAQSQLNQMKGEREKNEKQNITLRDELRQANMQISRLEGQLEDKEQQQREQHFYGNGGQGSQSAQQRGRRVTMGSDSGQGGGVNWIDQQSQALANQRKEFQSNFRLQQTEGSQSVELDHSPFRGQTKKSKTPHPGSSTQNMQHQDYSPIKGRVDPNLNHHARQNAHLKQPQMQQLATMGVSELVQHKQDLESEYQRLPITVSGKSMQVRKRKEELEFELDQVEKNIYRARQRGAL